MVFDEAAGMLVVDGRAVGNRITLASVSEGAVPWAEDLPVALSQEEEGRASAAQARLAEATTNALQAADR